MHYTSRINTRRWNQCHNLSQRYFTQMMKTHEAPVFAAPRTQAKPNRQAASCHCLEHQRNPPGVLHHLKHQVVHTGAAQMLRLLMH